MVRVIYLLAQPSAVRIQLVVASVSGERWRVPAGNGKMKVVTDRDMVDLAESLHGWTRNVYDFGCRFIHLSSAHDYLARDPFQALPLEDRAVIARYLNKYHGHLDELTEDCSTFDDVIVYAPQVLKKISSSLAVNLRRLQEGNYTIPPS